MEDNSLLLEKIKNGDNDAFDTMVSNNLGLVKSVAKAFFGRGYEVEDILQIGSIGLIKAIRSFKLEFGVRFSTYAVPVISGEIKRFLRDDGMIKVSRSVKELAIKGRRAHETILRETGAEPTIHQIAKSCEADVEELLYAFNACSEAVSLNELISSSNEEKQTRLFEESHEDRTINKILVSDILSSLPPNERQIITLRYISEKTQTEIATLLGISQVQVSRIEKRTLNRIKEKYIT